MWSEVIFISGLKHMILCWSQICVMLFRGMLLSGKISTCSNHPFSNSLFLRMPAGFVAVSAAA
jgi:hypothetical protein